MTYDTVVTNKLTGDKLHYSCHPREAVVCAYEYCRKNTNTWQYDFSKAVLSESGQEWSCGDFTAPAIPQ